MDIKENNILPDNTILYCIKDSDVTDDECFCYKDEIFHIIRYDYGDDTYLIAVGKDGGMNDRTMWFSNKGNSDNEGMYHLWSLFITKEQKVNRIRKIAKGFIKC